MNNNERWDEYFKQQAECILRLEKEAIQARSDMSVLIEALGRAVLAEHNERQKTQALLMAIARLTGTQESS